jgi:hypothetical protein
VPAPPDVRGRRKGCNPCTGEVRNLKVQPANNATANRQPQYVGKRAALPQVETALAAAFARALARREGVQR